MVHALALHSRGQIESSGTSVLFISIIYCSLVIIKGGWQLIRLTIP